VFVCLFVLQNDCRKGSCLYFEIYFMRQWDLSKPQGTLQRLILRIFWLLEFQSLKLLTKGSRDRT
jgi:hypothetical protein